MSTSAVRAMTPVSYCEYVFCDTFNTFAIPFCLKSLSSRMALKFLNTKIITLKYYAVSVLQILTFICDTDKICGEMLCNACFIQQEIFWRKNEMKKTKKFLSIFLALLMITSIIPMTSITASATSVTADEAIAWCQDLADRRVGLDYDDYYGEQCVDLIAYYYQALGATTPGGNGCDYAYNSLPSGWSRVQEGVPQKGDILVYSGTSSNPYGHVAIYESEYSTFHQNFNAHPYVEKITGRRYDSFDVPYWGYIRPDFRQPAPSVASITLESINAYENGTRYSVSLKLVYGPELVESLTYIVNKYDSITQSYEAFINEDAYGISIVDLSLDTGKYEMYFIARNAGGEKTSNKIYFNCGYYSLSYNANGGTGAPSTDLGTSTVSNVEPTRIGYSFIGWSLKKDATYSDYQPGDKIELNADTMLYAVWQKNPVTVSSISIATKPTKTEYYVGDTFNSSGLSIKATMSDGTTQTITSGFTVSSPNMSTAGTKNVTVTYSGKTASFTINVVEKPVTPDTPDANYTFSIQTPSRTTIRNKDGIVLHTDVQGNAPAGSYVEWAWNNSKFDVEKNNDGTLTIISENNGKTTFTATLYGADGSVLATDSIEMTSKAGFFDKIGGFFRSLFGSTTIYEY